MSRFNVLIISQFTYIYEISAKISIKVTNRNYIAVKSRRIDDSDINSFPFFDGFFNLSIYFQTSEQSSIKALKKTLKILRYKLKLTRNYPI